MTLKCPDENILQVTIGECKKKPVRNLKVRISSAKELCNILRLRTQPNTTFFLILLSFIK